MEGIKYKQLSVDQIKISLDRLTRFKNTKEKYKRVFFDIITNALIEPKYKKTDLENINPQLIVEIVEEIFNSSIKKIAPHNNLINMVLKNYENNVFKNDDEAQIYLNNKLDYANAINLINDNDVINLKWLKSLEQNNDLSKMREAHFLKFPIEKVLLVEGITEEILLPAFSRIMGYDFYQKGIQVIPAGGKNQVVKMYYKMSQEIKLPIFLLLDNDAIENIEQIKPRLRNIDEIHLVKCGEFEDLLPKSLIVKTVNNHFRNFLTVTEEDLNNDISRAKNLEILFKEKALHEFKKAEFAKLIRDNINENHDISNEIKEIINKVFLIKQKT